MGFYRFASVILLAVLYLGLSDGYLAIYENSNTTPLQVLPYRASAFPKADQEALEKGIAFHSQDQLNQLLEDFTS